MRWEPCLCHPWPGQWARSPLKSYVLSTTVKNFQLNFIHVHVYGYMYAWVLDVVPYGGIYSYSYRIRARPSNELFQRRR